MKFVIFLLSCIIVLTGCVTDTSELDAAMELRERMLTSSCSFTAEITADYAEELYHFRMDCSADSAGTLTFTVTEPTSIAGITGQIDATDAKLTFDDMILSFPVLADGRLTPIAGPWILINTLRSGYISACGKEGDGIRILADDSYAENALKLEIITNGENMPTQADIYWNRQRILCLQISNFVIL